MFYDKDSLNKFMQQTQKIQEKMKKIQEEVSQIKVIGESGAGLVKVVINGMHDCLHTEIDASLLEDNKEILEDLIVAAFNDAVRRIKDIQKEKITSVSSNMQFPFEFIIPF